MSTETSASDAVTFSPPPLSPKSRERVPRRRCMSCSASDVNPVYNALLEEHGAHLDHHSKIGRSHSVAARIRKLQHTGTIVYFCRSRGHGFIRPDVREYEDAEEGAEVDTYDNGVPINLKQDIFLHISDIDNDFVPRAGDRVSYQLLPMPPKFEKFQAVHVHVIDLTNQPHKFWSTPQSKEEIAKDTETVHNASLTTPPADI